MSLPVSLRELKLDKSAVLSPPVPLCRLLSVKENDSESVSLGPNPSPAASLKFFICSINAEAEPPIGSYLIRFDRDLIVTGEKNLLVNYFSVVAIIGHSKA